MELFLSHSFRWLISLTRFLFNAAFFDHSHSRKVPSPNYSNAPHRPFPYVACGIFRCDINVLCRVHLVMDPYDQMMSMNMVVR
ncbi:hypothetical protein niasHS_007978 [Heterodera schachtii]|uniref:Secreted protein n=1 Tax=Heterodera schachtii TaxID=97005 RepID=A0ABD2JQM3_HETSC